MYVNFWFIQIGAFAYTRGEINWVLFCNCSEKTFFFPTSSTFRCNNFRTVRIFPKNFATFAFVIYSSYFPSAATCTRVNDIHTYTYTCITPSQTHIYIHIPPGAFYLTVSCFSPALCYNIQVHTTLRQQHGPEDPEGCRVKIILSENVKFKHPRE